ncbi:hypothetical protein PR048_020524 [Dryococelus australis]|uniref:Reverse transcriptase RNase H-like domain-containing protein n=1 Tax=Dryococelus australis TaxID=614101 RepID=A0ABQ9H6H8_9NEOP|nr:hypothetical protein PR048_020524 [Dryococelus australis]
MCKLGILIPVCQSERASPIVYVPKASGGVKICIDFRLTLKPVFKVDFHQLPKSYPHQRVALYSEIWKFFCTTVGYLSHTIDTQGVCPCSNKVRAIVEAKEPENVKELRSFTVMLNFFHKFIPPRASSIMAPLLELTMVMDTTCKSLLLSTQLLLLYNPKLYIVVTVDASALGVDATLSHVEKPVLSASSTLTPAQENYSRLDKEAQALVFAVKRFHRYLYRVPFILVSDCQPLKHILGPHIGIPTIAAARIQLLVICPADALSKLPLANQTIEECVQQLVPGDFPLSYEDVAGETKRDRLLQRVVEYTKNGWPTKVQDMHLSRYFKRRIWSCPLTRIVCS